MKGINRAIREITINIFASIVLLIGGWLVKNPYSKIILYSLFVTGIISLCYLLFVKYERLIKVIRSGISGYYYSFPLPENETVWRDINNNFRYLGISSNSFIEPFRAWLKTANDNINYSFLLMNPEAKALKRQIAYEKGIGLEEKLNDAISNEIDESIEVEKKRIESAVEMLRSLTVYKLGRLQIKFYDEFVPWWMYEFDNNKIYLGILPKGERGLNSPVIVMTRNKQFLSPFDAFKNTFDRMWMNAKEIHNVEDA